MGYIFTADCSYKGRSINIIFIVNPGSPYIYISASALKALGIKNTKASIIKVNGQETMISKSHSHFEDCCVLGALFFRNNLILECNYNKLEVKLKQID